MGNMRYPSNLGSLKEYFSRSNVLDRVKKEPYRVKKSMGNIENKMPIWVEGGLAVASTWFSLTSFFAGLSYLAPWETPVKALSFGNPYLDVLVGLGLAGASVTFAHRTQTRLDEFDKLPSLR